MLKKTIKYTDFDGFEREETFYFHLSLAEITEMELSVEGGLVKMIEKIVQEQNHAKLVGLFKEIILKSYGEKSPDGRLFVKSEDLSKAFSQTQAYNDLFMELVQDAEAAAAFMNGIVPSQAKAAK